jgi:hypothetical protein
LQQVYLEAIKNKDAKLSKIKDSNYQKTLAEAASRWTNYIPSQEKCRSAGIDSSWNKRAFQGFNLYVVEAVAVTSADEILATEHDFDLADSARNDALESKAMTMEASVAQKTAETKKTDIICIDGSLIARTNKKSPNAAASRMVKDHENVIFISKSSESRSQFRSRAGDIYYYNHASKSMAGFSSPVEAQSDSARVYEIYARLGVNTPMLRIEVINAVGDQEVRRMLDRLCYHSVSGYPYCLKLAHNNCKVSNADVDRLVSIFNLQHEQGARDALNE